MEKKWKELAEAAKAELSDYPLLFKKARRSLSEDERESASALIKSVRQSFSDRDEAGLQKSLAGYQAFKSKYFSRIHFNRYWETAKEIFWVALVVLCIRWILIEPYRIPSGSMIPTLLVGDQLMVNKLTYGVQIPFTTKALFTLKTPKRGDVIIFKYPPKPTEPAYVKRVVGLPGDEVMVRQGQLLINGREVPRQPAGVYTGPNDRSPCSSMYRFVENLDGVSHNILLCHGSHEADNFGPVRVPPGNLFGMGDNRDNSADSRTWGFIPLGNLKGRALFIHLPLNPQNHYLPRWTRFFKMIR